MHNPTVIQADLETPMHGFEQSIKLVLPPMSVLYLRCTRKLKKPVKPVKQATLPKKAAVPTLVKKAIKEE